MSTTVKPASYTRYAATTTPLAAGTGALVLAAFGWPAASLANSTGTGGAGSLTAVTALVLAVVAVLSGATLRSGDTLVTTSTRTARAAFLWAAAAALAVSAVSAVTVAGATITGDAATASAGLGITFLFALVGGALFGAASIPGRRA